MTMSGDVTSYWEVPYAQPYFENTTKREITAIVGKTTHLHCKVRNLGDRAVSKKLTRKNCQKRGH
jgi:hypothetical protein